MNSLRWLAPAGLLVLAACGGGGDAGTTTTSTPSLPAPTVLSSSGGQIAAYVGTWTSDCGMALTSNVVRSVRNVYRITGGTATTATGTMEQTQYSDSNCSTPWPAAGFTVTGTLSIKVLGSADLGTPTSSMNNFSGSADRIEFTARVAPSSPQTTTQFAAFSGAGASLRFTNDLPFSAMDLVYKKH